MPKGKLEPGESEAEAAVREVREETGLTCVILCSLGTSRYQYPTASRNLVHKTLHWFLMEFRDGALEVEPLFRGGRFLHPEEALRLLTFANDREVLRRALARAEA